MLSAGLLILLLGTPAQAAAPAAVVGAVLRDQNGHPDRLAAHRGQPVVVLVVTAARLRSLKSWELDLRDRSSGLGFIRVVDIPETPKLSFEDVARKLRERVPAEVPILIDLDRVWARSLKLDTREANLLIFDAEGHLVRTFRGRREPALVAEVAAAVPRAKPR